METRDQAMPPAGTWDGLISLFDRGRRWLARVRADAQVRADLEYEIRCLDHAGVLDGALQNLGLARAGVPVLLRNYPGAIRRYAAMTQRLGLAGERPLSLQAGLAGMSGLRRRCLFCAESRRCERWLSEGNGGGYRNFCPNARVFDRLRADPRLL
jgi:hypothetical protein